MNMMTGHLLISLLWLSNPRLLCFHGSIILLKFDEQSAFVSLTWVSED